ncbi:hypothetical protein AAHE18_14G131000 [Arachis hypogaea]
MPENQAILYVPEKKKIKEEQQRNYIALCFSQEVVMKTIFSRIRRISSAKKVWKILEPEFRGDTKVRTILLQSLRKQYANMKMKGYEKIKNYYTRLMSFITEMKAYEEDFPYKKIIEKILISFPSKFDPKVSTIEKTKNLSTLTLTELIKLLHAFKQRPTSRDDEDSIENTFQSKLNIKSQNLNKNVGKSQENSRSSDTSRKIENKIEDRKQYSLSGICKKTNHLEKDCWHHEKPQCRNCKRFGHMKKDYRMKINHYANFSEEKEGE